MIVVLGGGLAGLSTALHLRRYAPRAAVVVVERESEPGGLARSRRVGPFTFDYTGHYLHLRDQETIALVETLLGDPSKAKQKLGWTPEITVQHMCREMVAADLEEAKRHALLKANGFVWKRTRHSLKKNEMRWHLNAQNRRSPS